MSRDTTSSYYDFDSYRNIGVPVYSTASSDEPLWIDTTKTDEGFPRLAWKQTLYMGEPLDRANPLVEVDFVRFFDQVDEFGLSGWQWSGEKPVRLSPFVRWPELCLEEPGWAGTSMPNGTTWLVGAPDGLDRNRAAYSFRIVIGALGSEQTVVFEEMVVAAQEPYRSFVLSSDDRVWELVDFVPWP